MTENFLDFDSYLIIPKKDEHFIITDVSFIKGYGLYFTLTDNSNGYDFHKIALYLSIITSDLDRCKWYSLLHHEIKHIEITKEKDSYDDGMCKISIVTVLDNTIIYPTVIKSRNVKFIKNINGKITESIKLWGCPLKTDNTDNIHNIITGNKTAFINEETRPPDRIVIDDYTSFIRYNITLKDVKGLCWLLSYDNYLSKNARVSDVCTYKRKYI
jgi:hypothetical protein